MFKKTEQAIPKHTTWLRGRSQSSILRPGKGCVSDIAIDHLWYDFRRLSVSTEKLSLFHAPQLSDLTASFFLAWGRSFQKRVQPGEQTVRPPRFSHGRMIVSLFFQVIRRFERVGRFWICGTSSQVTLSRTPGTGGILDSFSSNKKPQLAFKLRLLFTE